MVEADPTIALIGPDGPVTLLDVFEGHGQLIALPHVVSRPAGRGSARGVHVLQRTGTRAVLPAFP
jgi:hypothetical protein